MVESLYPGKLRPLNLTFPEAIITLVFNLEDELLANGKSVFVEFGTQQQMIVAVDNLMRTLNDHHSYALYRVLGNVDATNDEKMFSAKWYTLESCFSNMIRNFKDYEHGTSYRRFLMKELRPDGWTNTVVSINPGVAADLCAEVRQLMAEVRAYDEKREQALNRIEALLLEIRGQNPEAKTVQAAVTKLQSNGAIDPDGAVAQLHLSRRHMDLLKELRFPNVAKMVEFFSNFENFEERTDITLLEWWTIQQGLRNHGLLPSNESIASLDLSLGELDLSTRTYNCLHRNDIHGLSDLLPFFADGAVAGWKKILNIRNMGKGSLEELKEKLRVIRPEMSDNICFPTVASPVLVLDFDRVTLARLDSYEIGTVGKLLTACSDGGRLTGLRYLDNLLYERSVPRLKKYGFKA